MGIFGSETASAGGKELAGHRLVPELPQKRGDESLVFALRRQIEMTDSDDPYLLGLFAKDGFLCQVNHVVAHAGVADGYRMDHPLVVMGPHPEGLFHQ